MNNNSEYVICPCCKTTVPKGKFCPECGASLTEAVTYSKTEFTSIPNPTDIIPKMVITDPIDSSNTPQPVDDSDLTLLVDFCKKTVATVGGDGYDEIVLYEDKKDGYFQIHTYSKYAYMPKEIHHSHLTKKEAYEALLKLIEKLHLDEYEGKRGIGLCGGMYICKYVKDGIMHRVTTDNLNVDGPSLLTQIGNLLGSYMGEEIFQKQ